MRTRFAPSPTGFLHVGAFRTALFSYLLAKRYGGQFLLRIEDTDQNRLVHGALESIIRSMLALGVPYDEGPDASQVAQLDVARYGTVDTSLLPAYGGDYGPYFQSLRRPRYNELLDQLLEDGKAYYAFELPEELEAQKAAADARRIPYRYSGKFRDYPLGQARDRVANGEPAVIRLKMPRTGPIICEDTIRGKVIFEAETQDDFIIRKSDGLPPYHFAAIVDDHDMEISHVLRGEEWISSFPKHVCLLQAFGWEQPTWVHVPSVLGPDKKKLAKRHGAKPIIGPIPELKDGKPTGEMTTGLVNQDGYLPEALVNFLALIGWSPSDGREIMPFNELVAAFSIDRISPSGGIFDLTKLDWMNGEYIRALPQAELVDRSLPFLQEANLVGATPTDAEKTYISEVIALEQERVKRLGEIPGITAFFFGDLPDYTGTDEGKTAVRKWLQKDGVAVAAYLSALADGLEALTEWTMAEVEATTRAVGTAQGRSTGNITHPVRVATTGREKGPGLFELMTVLGKEKTVKRLRKAVELTATGESA